MKRNSKTAGISLVALVITIIVLIILTGAVIVTFMEGGIIDRAKESVFKNDMRTYQEILALKRAENQMEIALGEKEDVEINASTLEEIQAIIPEFKEEYEGIVVITNGELSIGERVTGEELSSSEELYSTWLDELGIGLSRLPKNALAKVEGLEVGDYVIYTPEGNNVTSYELLGTDSGYFEDNDLTEEIDQTITRQNINWRVLKNDGRQVTLISETPIDNIGLGYEKGFANGPQLLNDMYETLYSSNIGTARNLNVEDVNEAMGVVIGKHVKQSYVNVAQNRIYLEEKSTFGDIIDKEQVDVSGWTMPDENYREYELSYNYTASTYKEGHEKEYDLLFNGTSWLSSSCFDVDFDCGWANYGVRALTSTSVTSTGLGDTYENYIYSEMNSGRPVVILNTDVEVSNSSAGGDTVDTAWKLK